ADLTAVHLEGAYLQGAHLEKARLQGAHLKGARLQGAHLEGAYLRGVDGLAQWQIDAAFTDDETILPLGLSPDGVQYRHSTRPAGAKSSSVQEHICAFITEGDRILSSSTDEHSPRDFCLVNSLDMFVSASSARALQLASRTTGVSDPEFVRYLGDQWISHSDHYDHRFFFHLSFSSATPDDWKFTSQKMRPLDPDPIERSFRWITLDPNNPPDLPDGLGHRLPDLLKSMEMQKESK
ncbi:MAG: pentapeptide repeat-containing protein, partial [Planctomycetaceae bacterium]|nr:pentapeptide repeat-containing protein [Planctomycetaceae bacterium]